MKFRALSAQSQGGTSPPLISTPAHPAPGTTRAELKGESGPVAVAVDGRPASLVAVEWAAAEASARGVPLRIVHVFAPEWSIDVAGATSTWNGQVRVMALEMLTEAMSRAHAVAPQLPASSQMCAGSAPRALRRSTSDASLLVLGRNPSRRRWSSPLPDRLARQTRIPLAVIGLSQSPASDTGRVGNAHAARVLLILDEPALDHAAVATAFRAAHRRKTGLIVVHQRHSGRSPQQEQQLTAAVRHWRLQLPTVDVDHRRLVTLQRTDLQVVAAGASLVVLPLGTTGNQRNAIERGRALACTPVVLVPTTSRARPK